MGHGGATISSFVLCADRRGGVDHPRLCCWKKVACRERDMAYATILVRSVYIITGIDTGTACRYVGNTIYATLIIRAR